MRPDLTTVWKACVRVGSVGEAQWVEERLAYVDRSHVLAQRFNANDRRLRMIDTAWPKLLRCSYSQFSTNHQTSGPADLGSGFSADPSRPTFAGPHDNDRHREG